MRNIILISTLVCFISYSKSLAMKLPGPRVYVVTPSSRHQIDEGRAAPFYYHNWMRRIDSPANETSITTIKPTTTTTTQSPDLIFAEFESDHTKNIRKLLERERITAKTTSTTPTPIYVPEETMVSQNVDSETINEEDMKPMTKDKTDYFALYNNLYGSNENLPAPVFVPTTAAPAATVLKPTTTTTTQKPTVNNVENIWHIIDSEKHDQTLGQWDEVPISSEDERHYDQGGNSQVEETSQETGEADDDDSSKLDENFALPGFATNTGNDAENESRAIRTEPNVRFPYVNLKPFKMHSIKKPLLNSLSNSKKGNNMYTSLDNFFDVKNPVRGEVEDKGTIRQQQQPIDRYNPAQPYLPSPEYGSKSKQSTGNSSPGKAVGQLMPPPPPPAPQLTADDFPAPVSYESFPPYAQAGPAPAPPKPITRPQPPTLNDDNDAPPSGDSDDNGPPLDLGYRYKPPSPPSQPFFPTVSPMKPSLGGYSYNKPSMVENGPPAMDNKPDFQGYSYDKPAPEMPVKPFQGYQYNKPEPPPPPPMDHPPSYGSQGPPDNGDYPELIFNKPHGDSGMKGGDDSMGMMPPPAPYGGGKPDLSLSGPPGDDNGFPHDFPSDFKFHHDFDDHDFYHHHHPTTTTTTTETPRVNRYSYYYLGKKLYYLPLYFSVYFIIYVGALIIKAVLRHKIVYPNSFRPNDVTGTFFTKRSVDSWDLSDENLHEMTGTVTHAIATAAEKYISNKTAKQD